MRKSFGFGSTFPENEKLDKSNGVATNLQAARQPTITDAGVTSLDWVGGQVIIGGVSLNLTGGILNVPTTNASVLEIILLHTGGVCTFAVPAAQLSGSIDLSGATSGGLTALHLKPTGDGKFFAVTLASF